MYLDYYGLREPPFSITPDPRDMFLSEHTAIVPFSGEEAPSPRRANRVQRTD